jgi:hypothetical protein
VPPEPRDTEYWARPVSGLHLSHELPPEARNLNVEDKRIAGLLGGFGKMWRKTYRIELNGAEVDPAEVIRVWKANFGSFWPRGMRFYAPLGSVSPGDVALINSAGPGRLRFATGVFVLYADDESFSYIAPEGHFFNGMITFSSYRSDDVITVQAQALIRAQDPLYDLFMGLGGHRFEDRVWKRTLRNIAAHFGVDGKATAQWECIDRKRQWSEWRNIRGNAVLRSLANALRRKRTTRP